MRGANDTLITARLAKATLFDSPQAGGQTGVAYFNCRDFTVGDDGLVSFGYGCTDPCDSFEYCYFAHPYGEAGSKAGCEAEEDCCWVDDTSSPNEDDGYCYCNGFGNQCDPGGAGPSSLQSPWLEQDTGMGATFAPDGRLLYVYLDIENLKSYTGSYNDKEASKVLVFDNAETGAIKAKVAPIKEFFLDNADTLFDTKTTGQITRSKETDYISYDVVLGSVAAGQQGLVKGATAFEYIEKNTVKSIEGCTGALTLTGTVDEITVTKNCPTITIGMPDNVKIPYLSVTGATFTGIVSSDKGYRITSSAINTQTDSYTLTGSDNGIIVAMNITAGNATVTCPAGLPVGFVCTVVNSTNGFNNRFIFADDGNSTIIQSDIALNTYAGRYYPGQTAKVYCIDTDLFVVTMTF